MHVKWSRRLLSWNLCAWFASSFPLSKSYQAWWSTVENRMALVQISQDTSLPQIHSVVSKTSQPALSAAPLHIYNLHSRSIWFTIETIQAFSLQIPIFLPDNNSNLDTSLMENSSFKQHLFHQWYFCLAKSHSGLQRKEHIYYYAVGTSWLMAQDI